MVASWLLVTGSALVSIWVAAKVFRVGMLQYGQRLSLRAIVEGLRSRPALRAKEAVDHA